MATPTQLRQTFAQVMAAAKAAYEREKMAAVATAATEAREALMKEFDAIDAEMIAASSLGEKLAVETTPDHPASALGAEAPVEKAPDHPAAAA
jgi:hypothetical protein